MREQLKATTRKLFHRLGFEITRTRPGYHWVPDIYGRSAHKLADVRGSEPFASLARQAIDSGKTLLYFDRLHILYQAISTVIGRLESHETLTMMEVGVYKGGGSGFFASVAEALVPHRAKAYAVDTFEEGHSDRDIDGSEGAHRPNEMFSDTSAEGVKSYLARWPFVQVLAGRVQDFQPQLTRERFHFIHLDVDIYAPTRHVLDVYSERLVPGGIIVVDDFGFETCPGIKQAVGEFAERASRNFSLLELPSGQCLINKLA